ncbi:thrombospondin type 3 repeat-containing protein [Litorilituus sediminis]|nr:thrombospondin type 3 repeat-containing protein [Litorilituus sediminis]
MEIELLQNAYYAQCNFSSITNKDIAISVNSYIWPQRQALETVQLVLTGIPADSSGEYQILTKEYGFGRANSILTFSAECLASVQVTIYWTELDAQNNEQTMSISKNYGTDFDYDGVINQVDAFPFNKDESIDTDGDGIGNNADTDDDGDGVADSTDAFPLDASEFLDTDGDGIGNNADTDDDGDGVADSTDAFPLDASEFLDTDGDGIGNNADTDDDGDGVADSTDAFPLDASEFLDTDGDGIGNNADTDDDGDGVADSTDAFPLDASEFLDTDGDGIGNNADTDDDGDGVADSTDAFPLDASEFLDTDGDGIGNNADTDDDGDGVADSTDAFPLDASEFLDTDGDGIGNNADTDDDGDGVADSTDAFPLDASEFLDTDGDGIGNNADTDDDGDGVADSTDAFPLDASEFLDTDGDGIGNNADTDDDGDGILDEDDSEPLNAQIGDTQAPVIGVVDSLTFEATGEFTEISLIAPEVTDNNLNAPSIESDLTESLPLGEHVITWTATDFAGNQASIEQLVTVEDTTKPEFIEQSGVYINAEGRLTDINDLVTVRAFDIVDGELTAEILGKSQYQSGVHQIELRASDNSGNNQTAVVNLEIKPELSISSNLNVEAGGSYQLSLSLSGKAPSYPVGIDYQLSQNGNVITKASVAIDSGTQGQLTVNIPNDVLTTDDLIVTIDSTSNAFIGDNKQTQLLVIKHNEAPQLSILSRQNGEHVSIIDPDNGIVTIAAVISDVNQNDSHNISWTVDGNAFIDENIDSNNLTFEFDPSDLSKEGLTVPYNIMVEVTENNTAESYSVKRDIQLLVENLTSLDGNADSDGDGIRDSDEGYKDSDGDGIADYLDDDDNASQLPTQVGSEPIKTTQGLSMSLGKMASMSGGASSVGAILSVDELVGVVPAGAADTGDAHYIAESSIYSFIVSGLAKQGESVAVVIPLTKGKTLSAGTIYRKYNTVNGWYTFVEDDKNSVKSASTDANGNCPLANDAIYTTGLTESDNCVQLIIEDGGPNDDDLAANGVVEDPGVFAIEKQNQPPTITMITRYQVDEGTELIIDASGTTDAEGDNLTFTWRQLSGHEVTLNTTSEMTLSFVSPDVQNDETLTFELTVNDGREDSSVVIEVLVNQINQGPKVSIDSHENSYPEGSVVKLTSQSNDPDGDNLTYLWEQISGVDIMMNNATISEVSFTLPEVASDEVVDIQLSISDGNLSTTVATSFTIKNEAKVTTVTSENNGSGGTGSVEALIALFILIRLRRASTFNKRLVA